MQQQAKIFYFLLRSFSTQNLFKVWRGYLQERIKRFKTLKIDEEDLLDIIRDNVCLTLN
jgi:hypothetical protein